MTEFDIKNKLAGILATDFSISLEGLDEHRPVFDQVPIDSMLLVGIVSRIEQDFGVELPLSLMENPTLDNLIAMIEVAVK